jgi:hypothetical protein
MAGSTLDLGSATRHRASPSSTSTATSPQAAEDALMGADGRIDGTSAVVLNFSELD